MATDDFDAYVVDEPKRTRHGALKYQPPDADWGLDRLSELQDYFQSTYKRKLPVTVAGQGSVHNRLGYDHRASADISLHPGTPEGKSLIAELQRRKIPFLAFEGAVPGASTGPHIHVGRPSSRITNKFPVGSQVKRTKQQKTATPADDFDSYITTDDDFDSYVQDERAPAKPTALPPIEEALAGVQRSANRVTSTVQRRAAERTALGLNQLPTADVAAGVRADDINQRTQLASAVDEYERTRTGSSNLGVLRTADEAALAPYRATEAEVRRERAVRRGIGMPVTYNPITAIRETIAGEEATVRAETNRRMQAGYEETERLREIASQFTEEDKRQLAATVTHMRGMGAVSRGIETGAQRVGSGLLYKLAAITDLAGGPSTPTFPNYLGDYLRRQAARGEIAVSEIEADLPPPLRQQLADFVTHSLGALPEIAGAVAAGGPIGGFAALGGLEAGGRKLPFSEIAKETVKGAVIGGVFAGAGAVESGAANRTFAQRAADTARSSVAIGLGTTATEKAFGATDEEALRAAAANVVFHVGMRVPGEVGRLAQAAEKAYKTPPSEGGTPTVGPELQERLARTETPPPPPAPIDTAPRRIAERDAILAEPSPSVPPAEPVTRPPSTAVPAVDAVAAAPTAPSLERRSPQRIKDADWLELTPEERARVRREVDAEQAAIGQPEAEPVAPRRPLSELMAERADVGPAKGEATPPKTATLEAELDRAQDFQGRRHLVTDALDNSPLRSQVLNALPRDAVLAGPEANAPEMQFGPIRLRTPKGEVWELDLAYNHRKDPGWKQVGDFQDGFAVRRVSEESATPDAASAINLLTGKPVKRKPTEEGGFNLRSLFGKKETPEELRERLDREDAEVRAKFQAEMAAEEGSGPFLHQPRTVEEAGKRYSDLVGRMLYLNGHIADAQRLGLSKAEVDVLWKQHAETLRKAMAVEKHINAQGYNVSPLGEVAKPGEPFPSNKRRGEGGHIDLTEIREGLRAGRLKIEEAVERLRGEFGEEFGGRLNEQHFRSLAYRKDDPLLGVEEAGQVRSATSLFRGEEHYDVFGFGIPADTRWRYEPFTKKVYWSDSVLSASKESQQAVENHLARRGFEVRKHDILASWYAEVPEIVRREASPPVHHAVQQPRTPTGQFSPGAPGGPEADRSLLRTEARKYGQRYKALDLHQARRNGLDIVNDDVARNYFAALHRMAAEFLPSQASAVDRAETLYNQGKYGQATMLAESVFRSLPDKVNEYAGADAAMQLVERGLTPKANWSKVLQEVRNRLQRTGGLSGGGSTFYDVNKRPEGGRPDHAKIAYILEPVVEALKADASRLLAEGKLKAADYVAHVRSEVNKMLQGEEFSDWHPLNKSAALGVLVDKLRKDGPPPIGKPPTTEAQPPQQRQRSLPPTLERSGRDPGTNTTYDRLPNAQVNTRVEARLASEGADALETWYRNAPESADRTAAHRVLVDHYTAEAVKLADTAPQQAEALYQRGRELSNLEAERATTLGQAVQMYSNLLKYSPAGVMSEIARMERAGVKVPVEATTRLAKAAQEHQRLDTEVRRLERQVVEAEAAESGGGSPPEGSTARPRQYRPRGDTVVDSRAESARRRLDEAAQRRRAAKAAIAAQLRALESQRTIPGYIKRVSNITRGLMVSAFATAMRNLQTQALRFDVERLTDTVEHTLRRTVGLDSDLSYRNIWRNAVRQFRPGQTSEARELLTGHPGEYQRMFNTYAGGVEVPIRGNVRSATERVFQTVERGVEIVNIFNRIQEHHVRSAEFLAELDLHLRKDHNQTLEQFVSRNGIDAIPLDTIRKGVDKALEVTFSDMPLRDGAGGRFLTSMIEVGNYIPPTLSPVAFPRFMFNNLKFLYQYSPAGMIDLARKNQNKPRVIARSLVGTSMLLLAYQFRNSDHAGEKWYELKIGDTTLDARPFGPFSTYLFMAEGIRRQLAGEKAFTVEEIVGAIGASTGPSGTAIAVAERLYDYAANGKWDKWQRVLKTEAGEWGRALLTPVRQVKDLIAAFDASQAVMRDTSAEPFLGEIEESIPYADTDLPPAYKPTTATPIHQERPATKALSGWRVITPKSFIERELDSLNFTSREIRPNTGNPAVDALEKRLMGPLMDELSRELESDAEYKSMSRKAKGAYLRERIGEVRSEARQQARDEQPELYEQLREEKKPERQRKFEEELNSPGLSRAIDLGVPMPIPPRRPNEDDIAYRARLLQVGRQRRARLDSAINPALSVGQQRARLHSALFS